MDPLDIRRTRPARSNAIEPFRETASQTAGPYVHIGCLPRAVGMSKPYAEDLTTNRALSHGETIQIVGQIFEGDGIVCKDMMLEFWQADAQGDYKKGIWLRTGTNLDNGYFEIETIIPGACVDQDVGKLAPFISVWLTARGINVGLLTRIYFPQFATENEVDPHLALVPQDRLHTLLAKPSDDPRSFRFDIHIQGDNETVFFDV